MRNAIRSYKKLYLIIHDKVNVFAEPLEDAH